MSTHFSANQYDQAFAAQRLQNWEIPQRFKERPSTLEGFTQPISNDRGHILPGIPRSSKSPWGEFVGTWDIKKAPLRTKTMKTNAMTSSLQNTTQKEQIPSPKQEDALQKARTLSPQQEAVRTPSPREETIAERASPRPQSQENQYKKSPSPTKLKTPEPPASPAKSPTQEVAPQKKVELCDPS